MIILTDYFPLILRLLGQLCVTYFFSSARHSDLILLWLFPLIFPFVATKIAEALLTLMVSAVKTRLAVNRKRAS